MKRMFIIFVLVLAILELLVFLYAICKMILGDYPDYWGLLFLGFLSLVLIYGIFHIIRNWRNLWY